MPTPPDHQHADAPIPTASAPRTLDDVLAVLRAVLPELRERYRVESLGVFDSFARGEQRPDSDVDVLVTLGRPVGLFAVAGLQLKLAERLHSSVDVIVGGRLRPRFAERVMQDIVSL